ncbi:MAG: ABC transporter ATP-binding protein, partial [Deltaproteobacteria bacterium]
LILDEPTTGLDPLARREVWNYLKFLRESEEMTILVTTHLLEEAEECDEIALIDKGRVICEGEPLKLRSSLGCDVVTIRTANPKNLEAQITSQFQIPTMALGNDLRVQPKEIVPFLNFLVAQCAEQFESFNVGKPTLEDLFIEKTGHRFWVEPVSHKKEPGARK